MIPIVITSAGARTLGQLQRQVNEGERQAGALLCIGVTEDLKNALAFEGGEGPIGIPEDGQGTIVKVVTNPCQVEGTDLKLVCFGLAFVDGGLKPVACYRPA